jgi:hypothetical protein
MAKIDEVAYSKLVMIEGQAKYQTPNDPFGILDSAGITCM